MLVALLCVALPAIILRRQGEVLSYERVEFYSHRSSKSRYMSLEEYTAHVCAYYASDEWEGEALKALAVTLEYFVPH